MRVWTPTALFLTLLALPASAAEPFRYPEGKHGLSELRYINGVPVVHLRGTAAEMGAAYGTLVVKPVSGLLDAVPAFAKTMGLDKDFPQVLARARRLMDNAPAEYRVELEAVAKAAGRDLDTLAFTNTVGDLYKVAGCSTIVVEPARSKTGGPVFGRNFDWPPFQNMGEKVAVTVFHPAGKRAFASIGLPSLTGVVSGMNDAGLSLTLNEIRKAADKSPPLDEAGVPRNYLLRRVLEECATVADAETLMRSLPRTSYGSITLCDKEGGAVFEMTPKSLNVRRATNGVVLCTNHFRSDGLSHGPFQCWRYERLIKTQDADRKLGVDEVKRELQAVTQLLWTMQSMVFEPRERVLHLNWSASGNAAAGKWKTLDALFSE